MTKYPLQQFESTCEVLANLLYLARCAQPGSARQTSYLSRAEDELATLGYSLAKNKGRGMHELAS